MNWLKRLLRFSADTPQKSVAEQLRAHGIGIDPQSTVEINETTAFNLVPFLCGVRKISQDIAILPCPVLKRTGTGRIKDYKHPVWRILNDSPDDIMPYQAWREYVLKCLLTYGNSYNEIEYKGGEVRYVHRLDPSKVRMKLDPKTGYPFYIIQGKSDPIPHNRMLHFSGIGDGLQGVSIVKAGAQALSLGIMQERTAASMFKNGTRASGMVTTSASPTDEQKKELKSNIRNHNQGVDNTGNLLFLFGGTWDFKPMVIDADSCAILGQREFNIQEVARLLDMPPTKLGDLSHGEKSNVEEMNAEYKQCLTPWCVRIEAQINRKLFTEDERLAGYYVKHDMSQLARPLFKELQEAYAIGRINGWWSVNDIREKMDEDSIGPQGDVYLVPLNNVPADQVNDEKDEPTNDSTEAQSETQSEADSPSEEAAEPSENVINAIKHELVDELERYRTELQEQQRQATIEKEQAITTSLAVVLNEYKRVQRREAEKLKRVANKPAEFFKFLDEFYGEHLEFAQTALEPSVNAFNAVGGKAEIWKLAKTLDHKDELLELSGKVKDLEPAITEFINQQETRAEQIIAALNT